MEIMLLAILGAGMFTIVMLLNTIAKQLGEIIVKKVYKNKQIGE